MSKYRADTAVIAPYFDTPPYILWHLYTKVRYNVKLQRWRRRLALYLDTPPYSNSNFSW